MSTATKRSRGAAPEIAGKVERKAGRALGSARMAARGRARELEGLDEKESAKSRERVKGKLEETAGTVQRGAGRLLDDEKLEARGALRNARGRLRQKANR